MTSTPPNTPSKVLHPILDPVLHPEDLKLCNCDGFWHVSVDGVTRYVDMAAITAALPKKRWCPDHKRNTEKIKCYYCYLYSVQNNTKDAVRALLGGQS